jgi:hypothetical protein
VAVGLNYRQIIKLKDLCVATHINKIDLITNLMKKIITHHSPYNNIFAIGLYVIWLSKKWGKKIGGDNHLLFIRCVQLSWLTY